MSFDLEQCKKDGWECEAKDGKGEWRAVTLMAAPVGDGIDCVVEWEGGLHEFEITENLRNLTASEPPASEPYALHCQRKLNELARVIVADQWVPLLKDAAKMCGAIATLRKNTQGKITLRDLAKMLGISPTELSRWTADPITTAPDIVCKR